MKKLYTILLGSLLATPALTAQITRTIEGDDTTAPAEFETLEAAFADANTANAAYEGKTVVYTIDKDYKTTERFIMKTSSKATYVFRGQGENGTSVTLTRGNKNSQFFNNECKNATVVFENVIFNGDNGDFVLLEAASGCTLNLKDAKIINTKQTKSGNCIFHYKDGSKGTLENVTYDPETVVVGDNYGIVNVNGSNMTVAGTTDLSFKLWKNGINIGENFSPAKPVELVLENLASGAVVVNKYADASKFTAKPVGTTPAGLSLMTVGGNIIYGESTVMIGEVGYGSLAEAVDAAPDSAVITLKGDQTVTSRLGIGKDLIIKSEDGATHKIISSINSGSKITLLFNNNTKETHITLENLIIDGGNKDASTQTIEVSQKAQVYFNNVKVVNAVNTNGPVIKVMGDGVAAINGLTMDNCQWKAEDNAFIFFGNAKCSIKGETNISMCVEKNHSVDCTGMILTDKVDVIFNNEANERTANSDVLRGFTDLDNINFLNKAWKLEVVGENIRANVAATENSYKVVKCEGEYDEATAVETGETFEEIQKEANFNKYIVFDLPAYMDVYFANAEAPAAYVLAEGEAAPNYTKLEGNVLPVTGNTSFYIAAPKAQSAVHYVEVKDVGAGVDEVAVDENAPVEYYNLQGIRVENPQNGLYIKRQGNKAVKVLIK